MSLIKSLIHFICLFRILLLLHSLHCSLFLLVSSVRTYFGYNKSVEKMFLHCGSSSCFLIAVVVVDSFSSSFSSSTTAPSHHHRSSCHRYSGNCCNAIIILYCSRSSSDTSVDGGIIRDNTATAIRFSKLDNSHTNYNASSNASSNSKNGNINDTRIFRSIVRTF